MRCKSCDRVLPPHRICNEHGVEEDLCTSCLSTVYYEVSDFHDVLDKRYSQQHLETPITELLPDVNV